MAAGRASTRLLSSDRSSQRGFSLIELLIVVVIIAVLAAILIPNFFRTRASAQVAASKSNLRNLATALATYQAAKGDYPSTLTILVPTYIGTIGDDPCGGVFKYTQLDDGSDFRLESNGGNPWGGFCTATGITGIYYTPAGGLQSSP